LNLISLFYSRNLCSF